MANYSVSTEITGRGNLAEVAKRGADALRGMLGPIHAVNAAVEKPSTTALGRVGGMADNVAGKFRGGLGSITSWLPALGALGATASLGGLIGMTRKTAEGMDGIVLASQKLGTTTAVLSALRYGWKLTGVEAETGEKALGKLNKTMYDAATGKNKDAAALFARLGINMRDSNGHVRKGADVLPQLAAAFERNEDASLRAAMAQALFGKAGQDLIPFLAKGREWMENLGTETKRFSSLTHEQRASLGELGHSYKELDKAGAGLTTRISASFAPALNRAVVGTTNWIVNNRELIGQAMDRKIAGMARAVDLVSGAASAFLAIPFIARIIEGADAGTAFDFVLGAVGLTMAGPVFAALQMVVMSLWRMNAALWANPWVIVTAAIIGAAYAIYENWGPICEWFDEQMSAINKAFDVGFGQGLTQILVRFNPVVLLAQAMNGLSKWLFDFDLFEAGRNLIRRLVDGIKSMLPDFNVVFEPIERAMSWAGNRVSSGAAALNQDVASAGVMGDFNSGMFGMPQPGAPSPTAAPAPPSKVDISVNIANAPPGTQVSSSSSGPAQLDMNTGPSMR